MEDYKNKLGNLANKLKVEPPKTPVQQVQPVKAAIEKEVEVQFNNWIPKSLLKQIKAFGLQHDQSLKNINIEALKSYLKTNSKNI